MLKYVISMRRLELDFLSLIKIRKFTFQKCSKRPKQSSDSSSSDSDSPSSPSSPSESESKMISSFYDGVEFEDFLFFILDSFFLFFFLRNKMFVLTFNDDSHLVPFYFIIPYSKDYSINFFVKSEFSSSLKVFLQIHSQFHFDF